MLIIRKVEKMYTYVELIALEQCSQRQITVHIVNKCFKSLCSREYK